MAKTFFDSRIEYYKTYEEPREWETSTAMRLKNPYNPKLGGWFDTEFERARTYGEIAKKQRESYRLRKLRPMDSDIFTPQMDDRHYNNHRAQFGADEIGYVYGREWVGYLSDREPAWSRWLPLNPDAK